MEREREWKGRYGEIVCMFRGEIKRQRRRNGEKGREKERGMDIVA